MKNQIFFGPMNSGKTSKLLGLINSYSSYGKIIIFDYDFKTGLKGDKVKSRDGRIQNCIKDTHLMKYINKIKSENIEFVFINEGQFFTDLPEFVLSLIKLNVIINISALNSNFNGKIFPVISSILPHFEIVSLTGKCNLCSGDSQYSSFSKHYKVSQNVDEFQPILGDVISLVNDKNIDYPIYVALCKRCNFKK